MSADNLHKPVTQRIAWVLWPSFLMASVMEVVFFTLVQPEDLHFFGEPVALSRQAVYTLGFFVFWAMAAGSSALTCLLQSDYSVRHRSQTRQSD